MPNMLPHYTHFTIIIEYFNIIQMQKMCVKVYMQHLTENLYAAG